MSDNLDSVVVFLFSFQRRTAAAAVAVAASFNEVPPSLGSFSSFCVSLFLTRYNFVLVELAKGVDSLTGFLSRISGHLMTGSGFCGKFSQHASLSSSLVYGSNPIFHTAFSPGLVKSVCVCV